MDNELGEHDPYREMNTAEKDIRPDFLGESDSRDEAKNSLSDAEDSASESGVGEGGGGLYKARNAESKTGLYAGGKGGSVSGKSPKKGKVKGKIGKKGPIIGLFLAIFGIGGVMSGTQIFQAFDLVSQFQETFNSMHTSVNVRSRRFFRLQMDNGRVKNPVKGSKIFGKTLKISKKQNSRLMAKGIEFDDETFKGKNGKVIKVLKYDDGSGKLKIITADEKSAKELTDAGLSKYKSDGLDIDKEAIAFDKLYTEDTEFFHAYNSGSMTWKGRIANWFGTNLDNFLKNNKLTRNMFQDFQKKVAETDGDSLRATKLIMDEHSNKIDDGGMRVTSDDKETVTDEDGNTKSRLRYPNTEGTDSYNRKDLTADKVSEKLNKISGSFGNAANIGCAFAGVIGAINVMVQASQAIQIINLTTGFFESTDKSKFGLGVDSPVRDFSNIINEKIKNVHVEIEEDTGKIASAGSTNLKTKETTSGKTAMESAGVAALYSGGKVNPHDASVSSFNFESSSRKLFNGFGQDMDSFKKCAIAKAAAAAISATAQGLSIAGCIAGVAGAAFTFGISASACGPLMLDTLKNAALAAGIGIALTGLISLITPKIVNMMTRDLIAEMGGEDLGNALTSGANMYQGGAHRANGGALANKSHYEQFALAKQEVIAENNKQERLELSPFDISSKNTFLGMIMSKITSFNTADSVMSTVTTGGAVMSNSIASMLPSAKAYNTANFLYTDKEYEEICPYLASIGAVGDAFCNPYVATDLNTIEDDPADVIDAVNSYGGFSDEEASDGNVVISEESDLAKYIRYCDNRSSPFGSADYNIANEVGGTGAVETSSSAFNSAANGAIGSTIIGDVFEIIDSVEQRNSYGYISGESCVAGNKVDALSSPNWSKAKYYQRFIEDQSLAEAMGLVEKSAVTAYLDDYYEKHPLDNSYEGILARYSGLEKDTVVAVLDMLDYYNFVANYDSSDRYAFGAPIESPIDEDITDYNNEYLLANGVKVLYEIEYRDIRNRVVIV